jgi:hypothetical protein
MESAVESRREAAFFMRGDIGGMDSHLSMPVTKFNNKANSA